MTRVEIIERISVSLEAQLSSCWKCSYRVLNEMTEAFRRGEEVNRWIWYIQGQDSQVSVLQVQERNA